MSRVRGVGPLRSLRGIRILHSRARKRVSDTQLFSPHPHPFKNPRRTPTQAQRLPFTSCQSRRVDAHVIACHGHNVRWVPYSPFPYSSHRFTAAQSETTGFCHAASTVRAELYTGAGRVTAPRVAVTYRKPAPKTLFVFLIYSFVFF